MWRYNMAWIKDRFFAGEDARTLVAFIDWCRQMQVPHVADLEVLVIAYLEHRPAPGSTMAAKPVPSPPHAPPIKLSSEET